MFLQNFDFVKIFLRRHCILKYMNFMSMVKKVWECDYFLIFLQFEWVIFTVWVSYFWHLCMLFFLQNKNVTDIFFSFFILDMCWGYFGFIGYVGYLLLAGNFIIKKCKKQEPTVDKIRNIQMNLRQMTPPMAE